MTITSGAEKNSSQREKNKEKPSSYAKNSNKNSIQLNN